MKRIILGVVVVFLILFVFGAYQNFTGMAVKYECVDNDISSTRAINVRGIVTVTANDGTREIYTDGCLNSTMLREYSCSSNFNRQIYSDYDCPCSDGRCE